MERACEEGKPELYFGEEAREGETSCLYLIKCFLSRRSFQDAYIFQEEEDRTRCNRHAGQPSLAQHIYYT